MGKKKKRLNLKDYLTVKKAAEIVGVNPATLRRWDNEEKLKSYRHPLNKYRLYKTEELKRFLDKINRQYKQSDTR